MTQESNREVAAKKVFATGLSRIKSAEDKDLKSIAEATLRAAEILDELAPAEALSHADQVAAQRTKRATEGRSSAPSDESTSGEIF